ncbi:MAG: glycosyltransferase [Opitutales bacterium]|nr:glycosyltransferase [Opitutales bacterium]
MKISIITVSYNAKSTIERTIRSVLAQTHPDKEFVVIDGGSTDGTLEILKKYADKIDILVSEPDKGIYDAMNKGVAKASGDYLIFINADDYFYDEFVLERVAQAPHADFIFGDQYDEEDGIRELAQNLDALDVYHMFRGYFAHQSILAKRELFQKYGNFDLSYKICADWDWILRCLVNGATTTRINSPIAVFTVGGASGIAGKKGLLSRERKQLIRKNLGSLPVENALMKTEKLFRNLLRKTGLNKCIDALIRTRLLKKFPPKTFL